MEAYLYGDVNIYNYEINKLYTGSFLVIFIFTLYPFALYLILFYTSFHTFITPPIIYYVITYLYITCRYMLYLDSAILYLYAILLEYDLLKYAAVYLIFLVYRCVSFLNFQISDKYNHSH